MSGFDRRSFLGGTAAAALLGATSAATAQAAPAAPAVPQHQQRRVRFGLNYTPSKSWWYCWSNWDANSIRADLADIAALGMDHIRIMAMWPDLQPQRDVRAGQQVEPVGELLDLAGEHRLDVEVTVLDGAVSGFLFVPPWLINNGTGAVTNFFTDPDAITTTERLFASLGAGIGRHPRFLGFDLSNEIYWFAQPFGIDVAPDRWRWLAARMFDAANKAAPGKLHVAGIDHYPWLNDDYFSRDGMGTTGTLSANHTWAGLGGRVQHLRPAVHPVAALLGVLHRADQGVPHRPQPQGVDRGDRRVQGVDGPEHHSTVDRTVDQEHGQL